MGKWKIFGVILAAVLLLDFLVYHFGPKPQPTTDQSASVVLSDEATTMAGYPVIRVIDGDTIVLNINNKDETIRLIGVNTPETVDPRKPVQCFGKQASDFLKNMLNGKSVTLVADPTQADRDKYGRLLRYVYLGDILVDEELIQDGYGFEYTYDKPYQFQSEFKASQAYARAGGIGLWATSTCNGVLKSAV